MVFLHVGDQSCNVLLVHSGNESAVTKVALAFAGLACENVACKSRTSLDLAGPCLLETLCSAAVCLDFRHILLLLAVFVLFFGGDNHEHAPPLHFGFYFNYGYIFEILRKTIKCFLTVLHVGDFPATENKGDLGLVPFLEKPPYMLDLEEHVVFICFRSELDLFQLHLNLLLFCFLQLLALLVLELAVIHDAAYGGDGGR